MVNQTSDRKLTRIGLIVAISIVTAGSVGAETELSFEAGLFSGYTWRGQVLNDESVFQPSATVAAGSLSFNVWGNIDLTDNVGESMEASEVDLTASYAHEFGKIGLETGVILYQFPHAAIDDTGEVYLSVGFDAPLAPTATIYYDFDEVHGYYYSLGIGHGFELGDRCELTLGATIAAGSSDYHAGYFGLSQSGLSDAGAAVGLSWTVNEKVGIAAGLNYTAFLDSDIEAAAGALYFDDSGVTFSVSASFQF